MREKLNCCVVGATGMVGQRFLTLLENHPYFTVTGVAASSRSAGRPYKEVVEGRWKMSTAIPEAVADMIIMDAANIEEVGSKCDFIFCAVDMPKDEIKALEEAYAKAEIPVISNNSANRWTSDVPMVIPEINADHLEVIESQRKRLGTKRGFIAVKPNCSIQSYVPALTPLRKYGIKQILVTTYQAISGAGKNFETWPEMVD
ncbi:MAG: aspartate-semialdehyde dehydrogenase, partial [Clostridia bacterium]|nr:aspartate-semialdehyde dehydrogenase [Clostridia bacterium]